MLQIAFQKKWSFTVGDSVTSGAQNVVVWNDIHHKTKSTENSQHGYPYPDYLQRVREELSHFDIEYPENTPDMDILLRTIDNSRQSQYEAGL